MGRDPEGRPRKEYIHILMAETFLKKIPGKSSIIFKDGNKDKLTVLNLKWGTHRESMNSRIKAGAFNKVVGRGVKKKVNQYRLDGKLLCTFESLAEAGRMTDVNPINIGYACRGQSKTAGGFKWKYTD